MPVNIKTLSTYSSPSSHVTLCFVSALRCKNSVVSLGIGGAVAQLVASVSGVVLGGVAEVVDSTSLEENINSIYRLS